MKILLDDVYKKLIVFLNKEKLDYIVIGGIAAGILGEPRVTGDIDIDIILNKKALNEFLNKAKKAGFSFNGQRACFLTPEDFILLKIIPGRPQDLIDAKKVMLRYKGKLDMKYISNWAHRLCDEAKDMRIYKELRHLIA